MWFILSCFRYLYEIRWMSFLKCYWLHKEFRVSSSDICIAIKHQSYSGRLKVAEGFRCLHLKCGYSECFFTCHFFLEIPRVPEDQICRLAEGKHACLWGTLTPSDIHCPRLPLFKWGKKQKTSVRTECSSEILHSISKDAKNCLKIQRESFC